MCDRRVPSRSEGHGFATRSFREQSASVPAVWLVAGARCSAAA